MGIDFNEIEDDKFNGDVYMTEQSYEELRYRPKLCFEESLY